MQFCILLVLVLSLSIFAGCKNGNENPEANAEDSVKLWYAYNTENLMKDLAYPELIL